MSNFALDGNLAEYNIQAMKISRFLQWRRTRDPRTARWLPAVSVRLRTSQHTSAAFFSFLEECHRDRGIEERVYLSPELSAPLQFLVPTTHFWMTLSHRRIHFPHEPNIVSPSMTSQASSPHSSLMLGHGARKRPKLGNLKNHRKLTKQFFRSGDQRDKKIYISEKTIWGLVAL